MMLLLDLSAFTPLEQKILFAALVVIILVVIGYVSWFVTKPRCKRCGGRRIKRVDVIFPETPEEQKKDYFYTKYRCEKCGHEWLIKEDISKLKRSASSLDNSYVGVGGDTACYSGGDTGGWGGGSTSGGGAGGNW